MPDQTNYFSEKRIPSQPSQDRIRKVKLELNGVRSVLLSCIETAAMQVTDDILTLLWLGAGLVASWMLLPAILNALGLTYRQGSIDYDSMALEPSGDDAEYGAVFDQLRRLGFEPVGKRNQTIWFFLHHWRKTFQSRVFALRRGHCIALIYKLRIWDDWRLCFVTAFTDGAVLETANQMENFRIEEPDYLRWGLATPDRALLLERHREACQDFATAGERKVVDLPADEVDELIRNHEARNHLKAHRWTGLAVMLPALCCLGIGLTLLRALGGSAPCLLPLGVIAWGLLWPIVQAQLFRAASASSRAEDAHRQGSPRTGRPTSVSDL
jgi:hypothetical protein